MRFYARRVAGGYAHAITPIVCSHGTICANPEVDVFRSRKAANSLTLLGYERSDLSYSGDGVGVFRAAHRSEF